jgi:hypothetical protein
LSISDIHIFGDTQLQRKRRAAAAAGHSAQLSLSDFICICNNGDDSFSRSVSEQRFGDSGRCASASVSGFGVGDSSAALAFGSSNIFGFSVQLRLAAVSASSDSASSDSATVATVHHQSFSVSISCNMLKQHLGSSLVINCEAAFSLQHNTCGLFRRCSLNRMQHATCVF